MGTRSISSIKFSFTNFNNKENHQMRKLNSDFQKKVTFNPENRHSQNKINNEPRKHAFSKNGTVPRYNSATSKQKPGHGISECRKRIRKERERAEGSRKFATIFSDLKSDFSRFNKFKFLIDSGANVSLAKESILKNRNEIRFGEKLNLYGMSNDNPMCIIDDTLNIPFDGLIGNDFLRHFQFNIDYLKNQLSIHEVSKFQLMPENIPFYFECDSSDQNSPCNIYLAPRSETLIQINVLNPKINEGIIPETKIMQGVYLSNAITMVNLNLKAFAIVINTKENPVLIRNANVLLEKMPDESFIFDSDFSDYKTDRKSIVRSLIRSEYLNTEEKENLFIIFDDYSDVFFINGDKLSCTNVIRHQIVTDTEKPIVSKTYCYPEVHKEEVNRQIDKMLCSENKL